MEMSKSEDAISKAASQLGKRGWQPWNTKYDEKQKMAWRRRGGRPRKDKVGAQKLTTAH
jgi:hypothetical protein